MTISTCFIPLTSGFYLAYLSASSLSLVCDIFCTALSAPFYYIPCVWLFYLAYWFYPE